MSDGFTAIERLSLELPVELVLITQENRDAGCSGSITFRLNFIGVLKSIRLPEFMRAAIFTAAHPGTKDLDYQQSKLLPLDVRLCQHGRMECQITE